MLYEMSSEQVPSPPPILEVDDSQIRHEIPLTLTPLPTSAPLQPSKNDAVISDPQHPRTPNLVFAPPEVLGIDNHALFWSAYEKVSESFDKEMLDGWNKSLDVLLIFAGLFSAINTAFVIESFKGLQQDPTETTNVLLRLTLTRNDSTPLSASELNTNSATTSSAIAITSIFFTSLSFSLSAAFGAVTAKQWLTEYANIGTLAPDYDQGRRRQEKLNGLKTWRLKFIIELLPLLLQISLFLFILGVVPFLWYLESKVAIIQLVLLVVGVMVYIVTVVIGVLVPTSPFQTPVSKQVRGGLVGLRKRLGSFASPSSLLTLGRSMTDAVHQIQWISVITKAVNQKWNAMQCWVASKDFSWVTWMRTRIVVPPSITVKKVAIPPPLWDQRDTAASESLVWLLEHAEHSDVVITVFDAVPRLPPDLLSSMIRGREGLFERLLNAHQCPPLNQDGRLGWVRQAESWPDSMLISGIALCHMLKARQPEMPARLPGSRFTLDDEPIDPIPAAKLVVFACLQYHLFPGSTSGIQFDALVILLRQTISVSFTLQIGIMDIRQTSTSTTLSRTIVPFTFILDFVIHSAFHDGLTILGGHGYGGRKIRGLLEVLDSALNGDVSHAVVSHIAITVAALQMWCRPDRQSPIWSYPSVEELDQFRRLFDRAYYALNKGPMMLENVALAISVIDDTYPPIILDVYRSLIRLTSSRYIIEFTKEGRRPNISYPKFAAGLIRFAGLSSEDLPLLRDILQLLHMYPDQSWVSPLPSGCREDLLILLGSMFAPDCYMGDYNIQYGLGLLDSLTLESEDSQFVDILFSKNGFNRYYESIIGYFQRDFRGARGFEFMRRSMLVGATGEDEQVQMTLLALQINLSLLLLKDDSTAKPPSQSTKYILQEFFNRIMEEDSRLEWPSYFRAAGIIPSADGSHLSNTPTRLSFIDPNIPAEQMRYLGHRKEPNIGHLWVGECIIMLWRKARKDSTLGRIPPDWTDTAFFTLEKVYRMLRYTHSLMDQKYGGFDRDTLVEYLKRALEMNPCLEETGDGGIDKVADETASEKVEEEDSDDLKEIENMYPWDVDGQKIHRLVKRALEMLDETGS